MHSLIVETLWQVSIWCGERHVNVTEGIEDEAT